MGAPCSSRSRAATTSRCRRRSGEALRAALAEKLPERRARHVIDELSATPKSRRRPPWTWLKRLGISGKAVLVDVNVDDKLSRSIRNIRGVSLVASALLAAREVADAGRVNRDEKRD